MNIAASLTVADWNRLNRLLEHGLELDVDQRHTWLATLPSAEADLRPLLEQLLTESDTTGFATGVDPHTTVARMASAALAAMRNEQVGDRIGPWQLERLLAEGGMGTVWVAQRADGVMQRRAALKLPRAEWVDRGLSERIARERAILALLQHPHIAVLYDAGLTAEGRPYLALEYVDGTSIDQYLQSHTLGLDTLLRLFVQVTRAVAYAHGKLVIHRDLKPGNVLVTADGTPKLLDFGISKLIEGDAMTDEESALTRLAGRPLTLAYAAPEQILGVPIAVAADVYALGVMLFELATGARLYRATVPRALEEEILKHEPRRPSDVAADRARARALRGDLDAIILTALKREPDARYQSAGALADDIERYLAGAPVRAQPDSRAYRLRKFVARNKLSVTAGGAVVTALTIGLGASLWQAGLARDQARRATAMNTFVLSLIQQADPNASQQTKAADLAMLGAIEQRVDSEFKGSPDQFLQLRVTVGDAYRNRGELSAARRVFQRAVEEAKPLLREDDLQLLTARVRAADYRLIVSTQAAHDLDQAIEILRRRGDAGADVLIDALLIRRELGTVFGVPEFIPQDRRFEALNEAFELATRVFGDGSRQQLKVVESLAPPTARFVGPSEALRLLETSLAHARARTDGVASSAEYRDASSAFAAYLCESGRSAAGFSMLWDSLAAVSSAYGEHSVQLERVLLALADCFDAVDDRNATWLKVDAFEVAAARERPPSTNLMERAGDLLGWALGLRDFESAERYYQIAVENSKAIPEPALREKLMAGTGADRVCLLAMRGDADQAEAAAAQQITASDRLGRLTPAQGQLRACLSFAQRQNGRFAEAVRTAQAMIALCRGAKLANPQYCEARGLVAQAHAELDWGHDADALATIEQRLKLKHQFLNDPNLGLAYGRALLANGRAHEAIEPLRLAYGSWLTGNIPRGVFAAEAEYWFGQAWIANGEVKRGRWMMAEAREVLAASPLKSHRLLAARPNS